LPLQNANSAASFGSYLMTPIKRRVRLPCFYKTRIFIQASLTRLVRWLRNTDANH
jgi:hypothetical protein